MIKTKEAPMHYIQIHVFASSAISDITKDIPDDCVVADTPAK